MNKKLSNYSFILYLISVVAVVVFILIFIIYTHASRREFKEILMDTENFYTNTIHANNIISNTIYQSSSNDVLTIVEYNIYNTNSIKEDRINTRINLLSERIVHYQKTASDTISWWISILSVLFIIITGINFYSYNESKAKLEKAVEEAEGLNKRQKEAIETFEEKSTENNNLSKLGGMASGSTPIIEIVKKEEKRDAGNTKKHQKQI